MQKLVAVRKRTNQIKHYEPVDPQDVTLDLLILQVLIRWNLRSIAVPVVPPGVTLVFSILQKLQHAQIKEYIASQQKILPVETVVYVPTKVIRRSILRGPSMLDSGSSDFTNSCGRES